jgi:S-methylmethionine-dependent homocysteine/selenocysteine methylase
MLVQAAVEVGLPVVVGMTLGVDNFGRVVMRDDPNLLVGEMIDYWGSHPNVVGFSAMHCSVRDTETFVQAIRHHWNGFVGAYPNQGLWIPPEWKVERSLTPHEYADFARKWHMAGANAIGGCCGIGPEHISAVKEVAEEVKSWLDLKLLEEKRKARQEAVGCSGDARHRGSAVSLLADLLMKNVRKAVSSEPRVERVESH